MRSEKGHQLHVQAGHTRESGKFEEAVKLGKEAISAYGADHDFIGQSDAYGDLSLSLRHLGKLDEAEEAALTGIKIAEEKDLKGDLARPYFNLAKVQEQAGKLNQAVENYKKSIEIFQRENPSLHNRSGVLADMKIHMATCEYKTGDKSALDRALAAIKDLEDSDEKTVSKYNYDVWLSGGYMRLAEVLEDKEYLMRAKEIIDANPELAIRKEQWEKLARDFS
jgi:tetratricopeptide (TPR) repeat protein